MSRRILFIFACMFFSLLPFAAQAQRGKVIAVDLASSSVDITTGFTGAKVVLFGVRDEPGDLAVVVRGPSHKAVVRRKDSVLGMWMNRKSMEFLDVPIYYDYALSSSEQLIAPAEVLRKYGVGLNGLDFQPVGDQKEAEVLNFKEALIRNMQSKGLYPLKEGTIFFSRDNFFRVDFYVPSNVPTGDYTVKTYLFNEGKVKELQAMSLKVAQTGFSAKLYNFAHKQSLIYGIMTVFLAVFFGWSANAIFKRD